MMQNEDINNKILSGVSFKYIGIICSLVLFLLALLALYNHPVSDDYVALNLRNNLSLIQMQSYIYNNWGGRYTSNFLSSLFTSNGFLMKYYFVHTLFLLLISLFSIYYFLLTINKIYLNQFLIKYQLLSVSTLFLITVVFCLPEINTAFYWFSSSITYLFSFCCLLIYFSLLIIFFNEKKKTVTTSLFLVLLIITINGTNELAAILSGIISLSFLIFFKQRKGYFIFFVAAIYLLSLYISLHSLGNQVRLSSFASSSNILSIIASLLLQLGQIVQSIFSSVLFLFTICFAFVLGQIFQSKKNSLKTPSITFKFIYKILANWVLIIAISILPLLYVSNGSFPLRALNLLTALSIIYLICVSFYIGFAIIYSRTGNIGKSRYFNKTLICIFCIVLFANQNFVNLITSFIAAPAYSKVLNNREKYLEKNENRDSIAITTINQSLDKLIEIDYANYKQIVKKVIIEKPKFLFFEDDITTDLGRKNIAAYYHIKTLVTQENNFNK